MYFPMLYVGYLTRKLFVVSICSHKRAENETEILFSLFELALEILMEEGSIPVLETSVTSDSDSDWRPHLVACRLVIVA